MKKRLFLFIPLVILIFIGMSVIPVKGASVNDPENDLVGIETWEENEEQQIDCDWTPTGLSLIDIKSIEWTEVGDNYTVTLTFYGTPDSAKIDAANVSIMVAFLINGTSFPEDLDSQSPETHLSLSAYGGTVQGNSTTYVNYVMTYSGDSLVWNFEKSIAPVTAVALENWDVIAMATYTFEMDQGGVMHEYSALDHYNFDYMEDLLTAVCFFLNIPGYSIVAVGLVAVFTIGIIIKKKYKK